MDTFENITQENYDKLKIFLVTNFNMVFQPGDSPDIVESFEITTSEGKIIGQYGENSLTFVVQNSNSEYSKIINQIKKDFPQAKKIPSANSDDLAHDSLVTEYAKNSKNFYEHIILCQTCRKKLADIWDHLYKSS